MLERILKDLQMHFPKLANRIISATDDGPEAIHIKMDDDTVLFYDNINKTIRRLPESSSDMSELECREEFALRLRRIMSRKNISQKELSEACEISQPQLSGYLTGRHTPSFYVVDKIAKALDCSADELRYID